MTPGFTANMGPQGVTTGPDGNVWFTENGNPGGVVRVNPNGTVTELTGGVTPGFSADRLPDQITTGPDGHIWFTESGGLGAVARVNADGTVTEFTGGSTSGFGANASPEGITTGPDGNIWFTLPDLGTGNCSGSGGSCGGLGRLNSDGSVSEFEAGHNLPGMTPFAYPSSITAGTDGNLWFTEPNLLRNNVVITGVGRLNLGFATVTEFPAGTTPGFTEYAQPLNITSGSGGHVWFTELAGDGGVGDVNGDGSVTEFGDGTPGYAAAAHPNGIAEGPDGNMWFTQSENPGLVGRINSDGTITELTGGSTTGFSANAHPNGITAGPGGNVWFTEGANPGRVSYIANSPAAVTQPASGVGAFSATLNGSVNPRGAPLSYCYFEYGTSTAYTGVAACAQHVGGGTSAISVSAAVSGLQPATVYHFRLVAANDVGTGAIQGTDQTFTTLAAVAPGVPLVTTGPANALTLTTATLNATVNPRGSATTYHFDYGTSTAYGMIAPAPDAAAGSDGSDHAVAEPISGLAPGTTYQYRIAATNRGGTSYGADVTFSTPKPSPHVQTPALSGLRISPPSFHAASRAASIAAGERGKPGATISYRDVTHATATLTVEHQVPAVRSGRRCSALHGRPRRHARRCRLTVVFGSFTHADLAGSNRFRFTGRVDRRKLPPGQYTLLVGATNDGGSSKRLSATFRTVR